MAWHLSSDRVQEKITDCVMIFSEKMCQLCRKQTGLYGRTSTVDRIDKKHLNRMYGTTVKRKALQVPTNNLSSSNAACQATVWRSVT